jgi:hypothetical protein
LRLSNAGGLFSSNSYVAASRSLKVPWFKVAA